MLMMAVEKPLDCRLPAIAEKMAIIPIGAHSSGVSMRPNRMPIITFSICMVPLFSAPQKSPFAVFSFRLSIASVFVYHIHQFVALASNRLAAKHLTTLYDGVEISLCKDLDFLTIFYIGERRVVFQPCKRAF